jgi:hypothetical protein
MGSMLGLVSGFRGSAVVPVSPERPSGAEVEADASVKAGDIVVLGPSGAKLGSVSASRGSAVVPASPKPPMGVVVVETDELSRSGFLKQWSTRPSTSDGFWQFKDSRSMNEQ